MHKDLYWRLYHLGSWALAVILVSGCGQSHEVASSPEDTLSVEANRLRYRPSRSPKPVTSATPVISPSPVASASPAPTASPAPSASPSPVASASPSQALIDMVNSQTAATHEAAIIDVRYEWQKKPMIIMQSPSGADIPSWFEYSKPAWCYMLNSWHQIFEAEGNKASNTRVQFRNLKTYVLSESTRTWKLLVTDLAPYTDTWKYPFVFAADKGTRVESSGGLSFLAKYPQFAHGYGTQNTIVPQDIRAVFVSMETRLVLNNATGTDDRASARYLVNVGADYWPNAAAVNNTWGYAPGVGQGRFILATPEWRTATMIVPNGRYGSSMKEMIEKYPPPF